MGTPTSEDLALNKALTLSRVPRHLPSCGVWLALMSGKISLSQGFSDFLMVALQVPPCQLRKACVFLWHPDTGVFCLGRNFNEAFLGLLTKIKESLLCPGKVMWQSGTPQKRVCRVKEAKLCFNDRSFCNTHYCARKLGLQKGHLMMQRLQKEWTLDDHSLTDEREDFPLLRHM